MSLSLQQSGDTPDQTQNISKSWSITMQSLQSLPQELHGDRWRLDDKTLAKPCFKKTWVVFRDLFFYVLVKDRLACLTSISHWYLVHKKVRFLRWKTIRFFFSVGCFSQIIFSRRASSKTGRSPLKTLGQFIIYRYMGFIEASKSTVRYSFQYTGLITIQVSLQYFQVQFLNFNAM